MNCTRCKSSMGQTHQETTENCEQTWYQCPVCGHVHFVTRPVGAAGRAYREVLGEPGVLRVWAGRVS